MASIDLKFWLGDLDGPLPELYLAGGAVRDLLLDRAPHDIDLVCKNAKALACKLAFGEKRTVVAMEKRPRAACYRVIDRHQTSQFIDICEMQGADILADLQRRDFTINALAMRCRADGSLGALIDLGNGRQDTQSKVIRSVTAASIPADPLRILRAFRFAGQFGFSIEPSTEQAMRHNRALLANISGERLTAELMAILNMVGSARLVRHMDALGLLDIILPEIIPAKGCTQNAYHHKDVWKHSLMVLENCEFILDRRKDLFEPFDDQVALNLGEKNRLSLLKLAALLHDVGKPATRKVNENTGRITFYGHDQVGAQIVWQITERLKMSRDNRDLLRLLVAEHLHVLNLSAPGVKPETQLRWFRQLRNDAIPVIILGMADLKGTLGPEASAKATATHFEWSRRAVRDYYRVLKKQLERRELISGKDLISLGMGPGPELGRVLAAIREAQDMERITDRESAMSLARDLIRLTREQGSLGNVQII